MHLYTVEYSNSVLVLKEMLTGPLYLELTHVLNISYLWNLFYDNLLIVIIGEVNTFVIRCTFQQGNQIEIVQLFLTQKSVYHIFHCPNFLEMSFC